MIFLIFLTSINFVWAQESTARGCRQHSPTDISVPLCPRTASGLLSENYPIMSATVSDAEGGSKYVRQYVTKVLKAQKEKPPQFFLHVTDETFEELKAEIKKQAPNPETAQNWISTLTRSKSKDRWNWQQDYFESFFDPKTGRPQLREVAGYQRHGDSFTALSQVAERACAISTAPPLESSQRPGNRPFRGGYMGGNIEAVNGLCVLGDDHFLGDEWEAYAKNVCGDLKTAVKAPSEFLLVGHADEIFKTLKDPNQKAPCDFALSFASTQKGLETLKANPQARAFNFSNLPEEEIYTRLAFGTYNDICKAHLETTNTSPSRPGSSGRRRGVVQFLLNTSVQNANAVMAQDLESERFEKFIEDYQDGFTYAGASEEQKAQAYGKKLQVDRHIAAEKKRQEIFNKTVKLDPEVSKCYRMTNADLIKVFESNPELKKYNQAIQDNMDLFKTDLLSKIKKKYPQCEPKIIEFPSLFTGEMVKNRPGMGTGESLFPNTTNGEIVNDTYIMPEPVNDAFKTQIEKDVRALGLKTEYIDTHFAHSLKGNLHCSSHAMRYCRPIGADQ